jgi:hypothetical protein
MSTDETNSVSPIFTIPCGWKVLKFTGIAATCRHCTARVSFFTRSLMTAPGFVVCATTEALTPKTAIEATTANRADETGHGDLLHRMIRDALVDAKRCGNAR